MASRTTNLDRYKLDTVFHESTIVHKSSLAGVRDKTWRRIREIGTGSFGSVWLEKEDESEQLRAVKILSKVSIKTSEIEIMAAMKEVSIHNRTDYSID